MFRKDRMGRRGGEVLLYINETIPAYEVFFSYFSESVNLLSAICCAHMTSEDCPVGLKKRARCPRKLALGESTGSER